MVITKYQSSENILKMQQYNAKRWKPEVPLYRKMIWTGLCWDYPDLWTVGGDTAGLEQALDNIMHLLISTTHKLL